MADISEQCREYLREIDRRLQMISAAAGAEARPQVMVQTALVNVKRIAEEAINMLDEDCREILRGLDPKLDALNAAVVRFADYSTIHALVEEARSSIGRGGMTGGTGVPSLG